MTKAFLWIFGMLSLPLTAQQLNYATIEDSTLYVSYHQVGNRSEHVKGFPLEEPFRKMITYTPVLRNGDLPFQWCKVDSQIVVPYAWGRIPTRGKASIKTFPIEYKDSLTAYNIKVGQIDSLIRIYGTENKAIAKLGLDALATANFQRFQPLFDLYDALYFRPTSVKEYLKITYDLLFLENGDFTFFIRSNDLFEVWIYDYLDLNNNRSLGWLKMASYQPDRVMHRNNSGLMDTTYILPGNDDRVFAPHFFEGHFEFFQQKDHTFLLNISHGAIYYLGENGVHPVGRVTVKNYPRWILGKPLIIEDKDQGDIILFGKVEKFDTLHPFPKIRLYAEKKKVPEALRKFMNYPDR